MGEGAKKYKPMNKTTKDKMEMYADVDARGGILEPPGREISELGA